MMALKIPTRYKQKMIMAFSFELQCFTIPDSSGKYKREYICFNDSDFLLGFSLSLDSFFEILQLLQAIFNVMKKVLPVTGYSMLSHWF